jgi:hypothetical protein
MLFGNREIDMTLHVFEVVYAGELSGKKLIVAPDAKAAIHVFNMTKASIVSVRSLGTVDTVVETEN